MIPVPTIEKAKILTQALPYIQNYYKKTIVIKYGGDAMISNHRLRKAVISDIILLSFVGMNVVLVHGGSSEITEMQKRLNLKTEFINGLHYTDENTIKLVQMVLAGQVNKDIVNELSIKSGKAVGLSGIDDGLIKAKKCFDGANDCGLTGEIVGINIKPITDMLEKGYTPVIAAIAQGIDGNSVYNINENVAAAEIAIKLGAEKLVILADVMGVLTDPKYEDTLISVLKMSEIDNLKNEGIISGMMLSKVDSCVAALKGGVKRTHIIDGRIQHSILIEILSDDGIGTMFVKD